MEDKKILDDSCEPSLEICSTCSLSPQDCSSLLKEKYIRAVVFRLSYIAEFIDARNKMLHSHCCIRKTIESHLGCKNRDACIKLIMKNAQDLEHMCKVVIEEIGLIEPRLNEMVKSILEDLHITFSLLLESLESQASSTIESTGIHPRLISIKTLLNSFSALHP